MLEQETVEGLDVKVINRLPIQQKVKIRDEGGEIAICHEIFPIDPRTFISFFDDSTEVLDDKKYHMFGGALGFPNTASVANIPEDFKDSEERFGLCCFAEENFYNQYFENIKSDDLYLRYIHDFVFDGWYKRNLSKMVENLRSKDIHVSLLLEGESSEGVYQGVLIFKKRGVSD